MKIFGSKRVKIFFVLLLDVIEKHLPALIFLMMFCVFLMQIFLRYFFKPLKWSEEFSLFCYMWVILLASNFAERQQEHVCFSLVYDSTSEKTKKVLEMVGQTLVVSALVISYVPSFKLIIRMNDYASPTMGIPLSWIYSPYMVFLTFMIIRFGYRLCRNIILLITERSVK